MAFALVPLVIFLLVLALAVVLIVRIRRARLPSAPSCGACGYAVPYGEAQVCPECGGRYTCVGLRSSIYNPLSVWITATSRGAALMCAVLALWLGSAIAFNQFASKRTTFQGTFILTFHARKDGLPFSAPGATTWSMDLTLDASGPPTQPPDTMLLTLRQPSSPNGEPFLRLNAIAKTIEVVKGDETLRSGSYTSPDTVDVCISQMGFPPNSELRAALIKHLERMLKTAVGPTNALSSGAASAYDANFPPHWFTTSAGSSHAYTGLSQNTQTAIMTFGTIATFLAIVLWLLHCRSLRRADKIQRQRLIGNGGLT